MTRRTSLRALLPGRPNESPADNPQDVAPRAPAWEVNEAPADASQGGHPRVLGGRGSGQPDIIVAHFILFCDSFFEASFTKAGFFGVHRVCPSGRSSGSSSFSRYGPPQGGPPFLPRARQLPLGHLGYRRASGKADVQSAQ